jgi:arginase family enzyme
VDIVLVVVVKKEGNGFEKGFSFGPDAVRQELYSLYSWHPDVKLADVGNIKTGALYPILMLL